jgi:hypothetical protein
MRTNTTMIRFGGLASMSLAAAIAIDSGGATAYADPAPSLPDSTSSVNPDDISDFHLIRLSNTQLCVQPLDRSTDDVIVVLTHCDPTVDAQNWKIVRQSFADWAIINKQSEKCLYVNGGASENVEIIHAGCNVFGTNTPASNALWSHPNLGFSTLRSRIGHRDSGLCIDSFGNAFDGIGLRTFHCDSRLPQQIFSVGVD